MGGAAPLIGAQSNTLAEMKNEIENSRDQITYGENRKREVLSKIFHIHRSIKKIADEKGQLNDRMFSTTSRAQKAAQQISYLESILLRQRILLQQRLRTLYKLQGQSYLRVLFSANSPQDLERNVRFLSIISGRDYEMIKEYGVNLERLKTEKGNLSRQVKELLVVRKKIGVNEKQLLEERRKKSDLVSEIEKEKNWYVGQIKRIREKARGLEMDEESLLSQSLFFEQKGQLIWPVQQAVSKGFGLAQEAQSAMKINHKGLQFSSDSSGESPVRSVFSGRVSFSGEIGDYGHVVIIDHKDHYYSVYGNLSKVVIAVNQNVELSQVLGSVTDRGLYFEIRHFSQPENPQEWLRQTDEKIISKNQLFNEG